MSSKIILNEKKYIEEAIASSTLNGRPYETLRYLSMYLFSKGYKQAEIRKEIESFLVKCDPDVNLVRWEIRLNKIARTAGKYQLNEIESIGITDSEIQACKSAGAMSYQRLAFSMLCIAKFYNTIIKDGNGWVNKDPKYIFSLANVAVTTDKQSLMERQLLDKGLIQFSNKIDNVNIRVLFIDDSGEPVMNIRNYENLGYQYESYVKKGRGFSICDMCGKTIRRNSNRQKYCNKCRKISDAKHTYERVVSHRARSVEITE